MLRHAPMPALAVLLTACAAPSDPAINGASSAAPTAAADDPATPGLRVGDRAPDATVYTQSGEPVSLAGLYADGPLVVTFYRGGWCPYCNRAMSAWRDKADDLAAAGGRMIALTPESPDHAAETIEKNDMPFAVYSDNTMEAAKAYKVYFEVDPETQRKYEGFGIDLAAWNTTGEWTLPAPGTFVVDREGVVRYAWAEWDYTQRADPDEVIAALRAAR